MKWTIWYSFKHGQVKTVQKWKWPTGLSVFWSGPVGKDSQNDLVLDERILAFSKWQNIFWVTSDDLCGLCHEALVDLKKANKSSRGTIRFRISRNISSGWPKASFFILKIKKLTLHGQILHFEYTLSDSRTDVKTLLVGGKESTTGDYSSGQFSNKTLASVSNWNEVILKYK